MMSRTIERVVTPYARSVMKYLDALTAVSPVAAEYVRSLTDQPISIIPNGIDLAKYHTSLSVAPHKHRPRTILYIGRLEKRKGVKYLLEAFKQVSDQLSDVQLLIAGDGPDLAKLELVVEDYEIPNVRFLGYITDAEKLRLLAEADLFCSPAPWPWEK
jgi:phosphatidylinositol alpha-mannosyltransferase